MTSASGPSQPSSTKTNATWNILCDRALTRWYSPTFVNSGTINKSATSGTNAVDVIMNNTGTIHTLTGALAYSQGATILGTLLTDRGNRPTFHHAHIDA